jgi:ABC-2 type transport system ATP-binding protein
MQGPPVSIGVTTSSPDQSGDTVLRASDLTNDYGSRRAVNQVNLEVRRGEIVGFLGPNGAGKTTSIRMILGLITPTSGRVELFGQDLLAHRARLLPRVGALVETPALYLHLTGRDNLRAIGTVFGGVSDQRLDRVLAQVGLQTRQKDRVRTYPLGMKQRLGLGIALLNNPDLLVLDEPANGLDPAGMVEMRELLQGLAAEGKAVFLSSHLLSEMQQICSRVILLNAGKVVADETVDALTRSQGEFVVKIDHAEDVLALLHAQPWGKSARMQGEGSVRTPAPQQSGRALSTFLTQAGFPPESLMPVAQTLEEAFFSIINAPEGNRTNEQ